MSTSEKDLDSKNSPIQNISKIGQNTKPIGGMRQKTLNTVVQRLTCTAIKFLYCGGCITTALPSIITKKSEQKQ